MEDLSYFKDKVAMVTGASSGIGYATALELGRAGATVGIHYYSNRDAAQDVCDQIESVGGRGIVLKANVGRGSDVRKMFETLDAAAGGRLDVLVNSAGDWMDRVTVAECPEDLWDHRIAVNLKSVFLCSQQAARRMIRQRSGGIVNLGSIAGHTGGSGGTVPYAAAKAGVHTFTRGFAKELAPYGVRVNAVSPGLVDTPMLVGRVTKERAKDVTPLGRMAEPHEVASVILMLLSPACSFVTGEIIEVNGGMLMR